MSDTLQQPSIDPMAIMQQAAKGKYQYNPPAPQTPDASAPVDSSIPMMTIRPTATTASDAAPPDPMAIMQQAAKGQFKYTPPEQSPGPTVSGIGKNIGAALQEGAAGTMNVLSDPFGNLIGKPVATAAVFAHDLLAPHLGGRRFTDEERNQLLGDNVPQPGTRVINAIDTAGGAPTPEQVPSVGIEGPIRAGVAGASGMVGLGPLGPATNMLMGAGGQIAADQVERSSLPSWVKPMASLGANMAGNAAVAGGANLAAAGGQRATSFVGNRNISPFKEQFGDVKATQTQIQSVGDQLLKAAGPEGQQALEAATVQPGMGAPAGELVPGSRPTTAQVMATNGEVPPQAILEMDKAARVAYPERFNAKADDQNKARLAAIHNPAGDIPDTAEPAVLGQHFTQYLQDIDAQHAGNLAAGQQALTQAADAAAKQTGGAVQAITQRVGGTMASDAVGEIGRGSLMDRNKAAKAAENRIWAQYDPEGKLALPISETPQTAKSLLQEIDPAAGDVLGDREGLILKSAADLPDVAPARTIQRLRSNIGQLERSLRAEPGNEMSLRRLGMVKSSIDNDVRNGVSAAAAANPEVLARIQALGTDDGATVVGERRNGIPPAGALPGAAGGENGLPGQGGAERPQGGGPGSVAGNSPMAPAATIERASEATANMARPQRGNDGGGGLTPNITPEDAAIWASGREATLQRKQTFGQGPVGAVLRPGKQGAEFNVENAAVAKQFLTGNSTEPARVQAFINAVGGEPEAVAAMRDALVADLRAKGIIDPEGMVKADRLKGWLQPEVRGRTVDLFPGLREELGNAEAAQRTYDQTMGEHAVRLREFLKQAADNHIAEVKAFNQTGGQFVNSEPMDALKRLFASDTRTQDFTDVVKQAKGNQPVLDGLKKLTAEYIAQRFTTDADFLKSGFRKWIEERREPLKVIFGGQGVQALEMVGADMKRQKLATAGPAMPGSDTAQKLSGMQKMGKLVENHGVSVSVLAIALEQMAEHATSLMSHGALAATVAPLVVGGGVLSRVLRQKGIRTRGELLATVMEDPNIAKEFMARASAKNQISAMAQRRIARAMQASIINNAVAQGDQQ